VKLIEHEPAATVPEQLWRLSASLIETVPVAVPAPGELTLTVYAIVTDWPTAEGSGLSVAIVVVVLAWLTVTVLLNVGAVAVVLFAAVPVTVFEPAVAIWAFVKVTVPLAPAGMDGIAPFVPVDWKAVPPRFVSGAVRSCVAVERFAMVITGLNVWPTVALAAGGVIPVISSE
jgi:hypothetical protein